MKRFFEVCVLIGLLVVAGPARAQELYSFMSGDRLYNLCKADNPDCLGYVAALLDNLSSLSEKGDLLDYCPPKPMSLRQGMLAFQKYAEQNPEKVHLPAVGLVEIAFKTSFRCEKK